MTNPESGHPSVSNEEQFEAVIEALCKGDIEGSLTEQGYKDFQESLQSACESNLQYEGMLLVQVYCEDPSKVTASEEETSWVGLVYEFWNHDDIELQAQSIFIPADGTDPLFNPRFYGHAHVTIGNEDINWQQFP